MKSLRKKIRPIYGFLPVQLFFLHFRKYQLLLLFWLILLLVMTGHFAATFGAASLFLSPEYMGEVSFTSMFLLGGAFAMFVMGWNITTFIIHSKRMPFMGAVRQAFLRYCINNALMPLLFIAFFTAKYTYYQYTYEHASLAHIAILLSGCLVGYLFILMIAFGYFFRVDRNILKIALATVANPSVLRDIIPYDTLDAEVSIIHADTYLSKPFRVEKVTAHKQYDYRLLNTVLSRHHRNASFATIVGILILVLLGLFINTPFVRIPAASGFLILFSVLTAIVGAMKYFLRSWELLGWISIIVLMSVLHSWGIIDFRGIAKGINYHSPREDWPSYTYEYISETFSPDKIFSDKQNALTRLVNWKQQQALRGDTLPPLVIVTVSGGGLRSAYWTMRCLQYADSITGGRLFRNTVMITGASGGMIGATYWRSIHSEFANGRLANPYDWKYQSNVGKDLLNATIFSLVSRDIVTSFNNTRFLWKDRGDAIEQEMISNTEGLLSRKITDFKSDEQNGKIPMILFNSTIINDGRKLLLAAQPVTYLTKPVNLKSWPNQCPIDAIDCGTFFAKQGVSNLTLATALRINATFPYVLPVVKFPSQPMLNVMDAGFKDNFGTETATRFLCSFQDWIKGNTREVIMLQIRDTREYEMFEPKEDDGLIASLFNPIFVIQNKWEALQSYGHSYIKDYAPYFMGNKLHFLSLEYIPGPDEKTAALNFHLTQTEKEMLCHSIFHPTNASVMDTLKKLLR